MEYIRFKWRFFKNILRIFNLSDEFEWSEYNTLKYDIYSESIRKYGILYISRMELY